MSGNERDDLKDTTMSIETLTGKLGGSAQDNKTN
jgi:hypothetical protein